MFSVFGGRSDDHADTLRPLAVRILRLTQNMPAAVVLEKFDLCVDKEHVHSGSWSMS